MANLKDLICYLNYLPIRIIRYNTRQTRLHNSVAQITGNGGGGAKFSVGALTTSTTSGVNDINIVFCFYVFEGQQARGKLAILPPTPPLLHKLDHLCSAIFLLTLNDTIQSTRTSGDCDIQIFMVNYIMVIDVT